MEGTARDLVEHAKLVRQMEGRGWEYGSRTAGIDKFMKKIGGLEVKIVRYSDTGRWQLSAPAFTTQEFTHLKDAFQFACEFEDEVSD